MDPSLEPAHKILFTLPRTASNLVTRLLNLPAQASILRHEKDGYFFLPALKSRYKNDAFGRNSEIWSDEERNGVGGALQDSSDRWRKWVAEAEGQSTGTFVKEHINWMINIEEESRYLYGGRSGDQTDDASTPRNPTCVPDSFLLQTIRPTLLIRHPALTFPSLLRTAIDNEGLEEVLKDSSSKTMEWECTYHWHVMLFKFFVGSPQYPRPSHVPNITYPIIVDASDLSSSDLVRNYATAVGLDPGLVVFEWEAATKQKQDGVSTIEARMKDTLLQSQGVVLDKLQRSVDIDLVVERKKWRREFAETLADRLEVLVDKAMPDYTWLWEQRLKVAE